MQNLYNELIELLEQDPALIIDINGKATLNKPLIIDRALRLDPQLIKALISQPNIKKQFFVAIDDVLVFDKVAFQRFVNTKNFLPDSYTQFSNKIGLANENYKYITDSREVVLVWPHKDCVLEGGQTKEDAKRSEIFYNTTLAPDEIDVLTAPKVLTNFKLYDQNGESQPKTITKKDNLLIKGNNLLALQSLKEVYKGQVKLIYIDPPYNTGNDSFGYNDNFNHSTWLTFMKNRLEAAKELLREDGSIWINIDDDEVHYLKTVCDEIFLRENFIANIVWQKKYAASNDAKYFSDMHDHILVYSKSKNCWHPNLLERPKELNEKYSNPDKDARGVWYSTNLSVKTYSKNNDYIITGPTGINFSPPPSRCWVVSEAKFNELLKDNRIWFGKDGKSRPYEKKFLSEVQNGIVPTTFWTHQDGGHNIMAKTEIRNLFNDKSVLFATPKPEKLIQRIIQIGSNENDIVLDFFAGSATTPAVALKMKRRFVACEQMNYTETVTIERLKKVIYGEQGGISIGVDWQGGGSFVYAELMQNNQQYIEDIQAATTSKELAKIWAIMQETAFISYKVLPSQINSEINNFEALSFADQQRFLIEILDKNLLYVNKSEINDATYKVSDYNKEMNAKFYSM